MFCDLKTQRLEMFQIARQWVKGNCDVIGEKDVCMDDYSLTFNDLAK